MHKSNCGSKAIGFTAAVFILKGNAMAYPGRQRIYESTIRRMVQEALAQQETEFRQQHENDADEELLLYLRTCAARLQHTPWPEEIVGGLFIQERFGSWKRALLFARLPAPKTANQPASFARVKEETEKQKVVYRQRKAEKKARANERRLQQEEKKKLPE